MVASSEEDDGNNFNDIQTTMTGGVGNDESKLMPPGTAHDIVCEFILEAAKLGMDVEITGIDRPEVDKTETERLARLLLSVGPKYSRKKAIRWRS